MAGLWEKFINFGVADRYAEARSGFERRDADIMKSVYLTLFLDKRKSGKFPYISITILIISNICRVECTNSVLFGKIDASCSKWIWNNCHPLEIFNCVDLRFFTECTSPSTALEILSNQAPWCVPYIPLDEMCVTLEICRKPYAQRNAQRNSKFFWAYSIAISKILCNFVCRRVTPIWKWPNNYHKDIRREPKELWILHRSRYGHWSAFRCYRGVFRY